MEDSVGKDESAPLADGRALCSACVGLADPIAPSNTRVDLGPCNGFGGCEDTLHPVGMYRAQLARLVFEV